MEKLESVTNMHAKEQTRKIKQLQHRQFVQGPKVVCKAKPRFRKHQRPLFGVSEPVYRRRPEVKKSGRRYKTGNSEKNGSLFSEFSVHKASEKHFHSGWFIV